MHRERASFNKSVKCLRRGRKTFALRTWKWCPPKSREDVKRYALVAQRLGLYSTNTFIDDIVHGLIVHWFKINCNERTLDAKLRWMVKHNLAWRRAA